MAASLFLRRASKHVFVTADREEPSMPHRDTAEVIKRFNDAFVQRDPDKLVDPRRSDT
jgi:hypothetical protein